MKTNENDRDQEGMVEYFIKTMMLLHDPGCWIRIIEGRYTHATLDRAVSWVRYCREN